MKILALEFSSAERSVAALEVSSMTEGKMLGVATESGGRETKALGMMESALNQAGLRREEIECLVVGLGPGSYTGIRIAISIAQGWQLARNVKLLGISTVDCIAEMARDAGVFGPFAVAIDAHRGEFYLGDFAAALNHVTIEAGLHIVSAEEINGRLANGERVVGPGLTQFFPEAVDLYPSADALGLLAKDRSDFVSGEELEPIYLRETNFVKAPTPRIIS